jgi:manganese/iron transport system substrate-binding protein
MKALLLLAPLTLAACSPAPEVPVDGRKRVLTTFTILADMARNIAGDAAVVESITKPGAEIHDYEPTPQDLVKVKDADLLLWNGLGLERWFERFFQQAQGAASAVLSEGIEPMGIGEGPYEGKPNPHAWMSPANALVYVENIRRALSELDPANAPVYAANAAAYAERLRAVEAPVRDALAAVPENRRWLVTSEGAFSYLARDFGLKELYLWPINADEEGTPQQVRRVVDTVRAQGIPAVFSESTVSDKPMRQVAKETGARYAGVLYVDSLTGPDGPVPTYLDLLHYNARALAEAFAAP